MGLPYLVAGVGIGVYIKGGTLKESVFWGGVTYGGAHVITHPIQSTKAFARGARYAFTTSLRTMAGDAVGAGATQIAVGAALGYVIGAVVGTSIVYVLEEEGLVKEGSTADVLDFYMGEGHYWDQGDRPTPGYFNIPGNIEFIWENI